MTNIFHPSFTGSFRPESFSQDFIEKLAERLRSGLFPAASDRRNQYEIATQSDGFIRFRSVNLLSGINLGPNDVSIEVDREKRQVSFKVTYWTWAKYCIGLGLIIGCFGVVGRYLLMPESYSSPNLDIVFWPSVIFWCVLWPWLLIPVHRGPARKCLTRILDEINSQGKENT
ncbi:MAG: hypothetical protein ACYSWO_04310 [Planctomycetota bacterium]|jgi:hypothetical protein